MIVEKWNESSVHILSHTLHYGTGVFEGVRAYKTKNGAAIFRLEDHTSRLFESARLIGMKIPFDAKELNNAQYQVVKINNLKNAYIRPMCFYGSEGMGLRADNLKGHKECDLAWLHSSGQVLLLESCHCQVNLVSYLENKNILSPVPC